MNSVILIGRLTADAQTHAGDKHESATFRLAVPRTGSDGADFVDIVTFDKLASVCGEYLTKGREVPWSASCACRSGRAATARSAPASRSWPTPSSSSASRRSRPSPTATWPSPPPARPRQYRKAN